MSYLARERFLRHPPFFEHGATAKSRSVAVKHDVGIVDLEHGKIFYTLKSVHVIFRSALSDDETLPQRGNKRRH